MKSDPPIHRDILTDPPHAFVIVEADIVPHGWSWSGSVHASHAPGPARPYMGPGKATVANFVEATLGSMANLLYCLTRDKTQWKPGLPIIFYSKSWKANAIINYWLSDMNESLSSPSASQQSNITLQKIRELATAHGVPWIRARVPENT